MAIVDQTFGRNREISGERGELAAPMLLVRRETVTATVTTNLFTTFLTTDALVGGRRLFAATPMVHIMPNKAPVGANAAITDFLAVAGYKYAPATGQLDWWMTKIVTTTPTIVAVGDGAFEFMIWAVGAGF